MILGLDPGKDGAAALLDKEQASTINFARTTDLDLWRWFVEARPYVTKAYLERVGAMPKQGVASMFKFGTSYGFARGLLVALEIPFELVGAYQWQKQLGIPSRGSKSKPEHKRVLKQRAQELFPGLKITLANCDALLIAEWGRRHGK